jgi:hypothetical protein
MALELHFLASWFHEKIGLVKQHGQFGHFDLTVVEEGETVIML